MFKSALVSWKTTVLGALAFVCATSEYTGMLPPKWGQSLSGLCMILLALGVISSKDANVTNSPTPVSPQPVPDSVPPAPTVS